MSVAEGSYQDNGRDDLLHLFYNSSFVIPSACSVLVERWTDSLWLEDEERGVELELSRAETESGRSALLGSSKYSMKCAWLW